MAHTSLPSTGEVKPGTPVRLSVAAGNAVPNLYTLEEIADLLRYTGRDRARSVRRLFERCRISLLRRDRSTFLATEHQLETLLEALTCSPSESAAGSTTSVARSASV